MPYLISLLAVGAAGVVLLVLLVRLSTPIRRLSGTAHLCGAYLTERTNLLKARIAGLRVELGRRRARRARSSDDPRAA